MPAFCRPMWTDSEARNCRSPFLALFRFSRAGSMEWYLSAQQRGEAKIQSTTGQEERTRIILDEKERRCDVQTVHGEKERPNQ
jgi:hypothetical protein